MLPPGSASVSIMVHPTGGVSGLPAPPRTAICATIRSFGATPVGTGMVTWLLPPDEVLPVAFERSEMIPVPGVGVAVGDGVPPGVGVVAGGGEVVGVGEATDPLLTVTDTETVARTVLLVEKALTTNVCWPLGRVVVSKAILHLPPDGEHTPPLPVPSG